MEPDSLSVFSTSALYGADHESSRGITQRNRAQHLCRRRRLRRAESVARIGIGNIAVCAGSGNVVVGRRGIANVGAGR
jgi:hypothetical protein